jgi:streptogramin lyase
MRQGLLFPIAIVLSVTALLPPHGAAAREPAAPAPLAGTVRGPDGKAMEGVTVSAAIEGGTITTSVYTDERGRYFFPTLPAGNYRVRAQAVGYQAGRAEVGLALARQTHQDFALQALKDFERQLTSPEWLAALPDDKPGDLRLKQIFVNSCTTCHSAAFALQNRFDPAGWETILARMETIDVYGKAGAPASPIITHYKAELAPYLARVRGPGPSPLHIKPYPRPTGEAARVVVTEFAIPSAASPNELVDQDGGDWSEGIPGVGNGAGGLHDIAIDHNGNAWVSNGIENRNRSFLKLDVKTGKVTDFKLDAPNGFARGTHGVAEDQNGTIWFNVFANGGTFGRGSLLRVDPDTAKYDVFASPEEMGTVGISVQVDAKGKIWASSDGAIVFDPAARKFTYFKPLTPGTGGYGVTGDADGNGWFCQPGVDIVGIADFATQTVSELRLPPRPGADEISTEEDRSFFPRAISSFTTGILPGEGPRRMTAQGNYVWWSDWFGQSLARVNIRTHEVKYFPAPPNLSPYTMVADKNGMLWVALPNDDRVAKLNPETRQWTIYNLPSRGTNTRFITVDRHKDTVEVWSVSFVTSKVVRVQLRTKQQTEALASLNR